jgi:hypothetical protein
MSSNRICSIVGPHGSGKTTLLQCYAKHVALSHDQVSIRTIFATSCSGTSTTTFFFCIMTRLMFCSRVSNPVNLPGSTECGFLMRKMCAPSTGNQPRVPAFLATCTLALGLCIPWICSIALFYHSYFVCAQSFPVFLHGHCVVINDASAAYFLDCSGLLAASFLR